MSGLLLLNDNSAHLNWGAQATPPGLIRIITRAWPEVAIETIPHAWLRRRTMRVTAPLLRGTVYRRGAVPHMQWLLNAFSEELEPFPQVADDFDEMARRWLDGRGGEMADEFLALARRHDVICYNGENSLYRNTVEGRRALFLLYVAKTRLGKPTCVVNHTAHITGVLPIMKAMIELVYPQLDLVAVREARSLQLLTSLGIGTAELYPDVVFALEPPQRPSERFTAWLERSGLGERAFFCVSASGLPSSRPSGDYDGAFAELVRGLKATGLQAVLVAKDGPCQFLAEVARRTGALYFGPEHAYSDLWPLFARASFVVTGHFHYIVFAAAVGCPFIPLSANNHKLAGLCEHLGWERTEPYDITWLRPQVAALVAEARALLAQGEGLRQRLRARAAEMHDETRRLGERIRRLAG